MSEQTGTVRLHRVLRAPTERVYRAFTDKSALEYWLPPYGFTGSIDEMDVRVGGGYRMTFFNFSGGGSDAFTVEYLALEPGKHICHTDRFDSDELPGEMTVTIDFREVACGTELTIVQAGIPAIIPEEMCYLGWQESLEQLAHLVEPDIPAEPG
ncbi:MAG: SRPBCC family protein [Alcanivorax sediminis]|uniref:SRPBCC family protein n=1 Tax=Alcanivorax sediminis TaxID=2663008 RepID=UPI003C4865C6